MVKGDTIWALCQKYYGTVDGKLCAQVAAYNGIKNPNLIYPGDVIKFPPLETARGISAPPLPPSAKQVTKTTIKPTNESGGSSSAPSDPLYRPPNFWEVQSPFEPPKGGSSQVPWMVKKP